MSRFSRQSFLGVGSERRLAEATIGIVGLGGGGSHVVQQSGHIGIGGEVLVDPDHSTITNTNRLIGGTLDDLEAEGRPATKKVAIGERMLRGLMEAPRVTPLAKSWHDTTEELKQCDIIVGAVDSVTERDQLERFARRHLIPYVDIGMDVHALAKGGFLISGQVVLSMPGHACLRCCGIVTDARLGEEAGRYGAAGEAPQVVWPNGVLASTAIGLIVQLLSPWFMSSPQFVYLDYDGNQGTLVPNTRMELYKDRVCPHHPAEETGDPLFDVREFTRAVAERQAARQAALQVSLPRPSWWVRFWQWLLG